MGSWGGSAMRGLRVRRVLPALFGALILAACNDASQNTRAGLAGDATSASANGITIQGAVPSIAFAGRDYSAQVKATARGRNVVGYIISNKPRWVAFDTATGSIHGTP